MTLNAPRPLSVDHDTSLFDSGRPVLDNWLRERALKNEQTGASRTYVVCNDERVVGFYSLATGAVENQSAPGKIRRTLPDPIPIMLMGWLAVDRSQQGTGLGSALLKDAILRTLRAAEIAGIRTFLAHALDEEAARFYRERGFMDSLIDPLTLMLPMATARWGAEDAGR